MSEVDRFPPLLPGDNLLERLVSPGGLAALACAFFLAACVIPPSIYSRIMAEPDLMFLDPLTILFYLSCVVSFILGAWLVKMAALRFNRTAFVFRTKIPAAAFLLIPLLSGTVFSIASSLLLVRQNPDLVLLLLSQQGADFKSETGLVTEGTLSFAPVFLVAFVWWAFWRSYDLQPQGLGKRLVNSALVLAVLSVLVSATLTLGRLIVMVLLSGLAILYFLRRASRGTFRRTLAIGFLAVVCAVSMFVGFSFLRGTEGWDKQLYLLVGYTAASYNRLAAMVHGLLRYPFSGRGLYLSYGISFSHKINAILPMNKAFGWPDQVEVWGSEFGAVSRAGLDGTMIWSGAFGYIYSDLGWFSVVFVFGYGLLYGIVWKLIQLGHVTGIVLYPFFGFCVFYWCGANYLLDSTVMILAGAAALLAVYERLCLKRSRQTDAGS